MSITRLIALKLSNYNDKDSFVSRLRKKRIAPLLLLIKEVLKEKEQVKIIDIGGTVTYWNIISQDFLVNKKVHITIVNLPGSDLPDDFGNFRFVEADGCDLSFIEDNSFDIAHSNSVVEHVGNWNKMVQFANELSRVAPRYFVQTTNYWFPIEPHFMFPFFHWLPMPVRVSLLMNFNIGYWKKSKTVNQAMHHVEIATLLDRKMFKELFQDAKIYPEKFFLLTKSFVAVKR